MSTTGLRLKVLGAYAKLLRSQRKAFQKDYKTREKALEQSRLEFRKHSTVDDPAKIEDLLNQSEAVSDFLQRNLIQAEQTGEKAFKRRARRDRDKDRDRDREREREESSRETIVHEDHSTTVTIPMPSVKIPSDAISKNIYEPITAPPQKKKDAPVSTPTPTPSTEGAQ